MWDESANSFKVDGTNESNFSVYEGNVYRIINESGSGNIIFTTIILNGDEYNHINPFNRIAVVSKLFVLQNLWHSMQEC